LRLVGLATAMAAGALGPTMLLGWSVLAPVLRPPVLPTVTLWRAALLLALVATVRAAVIGARLGKAGQRRQQHEASTTGDNDFLHVKLHGAFGPCTFSIGEKTTGNVCKR